MLIILAIATILATILGGYLALKLKDKLHYALGFSAGALIAVAIFDLVLPKFMKGGAWDWLYTSPDN